MRYSLTLSVTVFILAVLTHAASTTPDGIPASFVQPPRNRTDFDSIFSYISQHTTLPTRTSRNIQISSRQTDATPEFFELAFGPIDGANNAEGYMGFVPLPTYDVDACAASCNTRGFDNTVGPCIFFNLWTAVVNGTAATNICSLYNTITDNSTATNTDQAGIEVTASLGYSRKSLLQDGSFQDYTCVTLTLTSPPCNYEPSDYWTRFVLVGYDYVLIGSDNPAHSGTSSAQFFLSPPPPGSDYPGYGSTLTYTLPIKATVGKTYVISLFYTQNVLYPNSGDTGPMVSVIWNGVSVIDAVGYAYLNGYGLRYYNLLVEVVAQGGDTFALKNSVLFAHVMFVDDIAIFEKWY